jgi:hypothetical protein
MGIESGKEYVKFYINLGIQDKISLLQFIQNEKLILKNKLENKKTDKNFVLNGIKIIEKLIKEIESLGEKKVLEKYE